MGSIDYKEHMPVLRNMLSKYWLPRVLKHDNDLLIVIEGKEGSSKSTLALLLSHYFMQLQGREFSLSNIHYSVDTVGKNIFNSQSGDVQLIDEGALVGLAHDAMTKDAKRMVKILTTCRSKNNLILICVPNINLLNRYLRNHRLTGVLKITSKGHVDIYDGSAYRNALYKEKYSGKKKLKHSSIKDRYPKAQAILGQTIWDDYEEHKHEQLLEGKPDEVTVNPRDKVWLSLYDNGMPMRKIGEATGTPFSTVQSAIRRIRPISKN